MRLTAMERDSAIIHFEHIGQYKEIPL